MKKAVIQGFVLILAMVLLTITACKKTTDSPNYTEPITIFKPDSLQTDLLAGTTQPVHIRVTTDRPLIYVKCMYEIDTSHNANHIYTYPDTLFAVRLDTIPTSLTSNYEYNGNYHIPDTLNGLDIVRFRVSMKAAMRDNGQSHDTIGYTKEFKIRVK